MKFIKYFNIIIVLLLVFSCQKEEIQNPPTVLTNSATNIEIKSATLNGEVTEEGFSTTTSRGFVYSKSNSSPTISDSKLLLGSGKGVFSVILTPLDPNSKYYYRAFATNSKGTTLGTIESFTTNDYKLPLSLLSAPTNVSYTSVNLSGSVTDEGGGSVSESGFVLGMNSSPTISDLKFTVSKGKTTYSLVVTKLVDNKKYYVRTYAINEKGISYGAGMSFITKQQVTPKVALLNVVSVDYFKSVLNFGFIDAGGSQITEYGICVSESINPTILDSKQYAGLYYNNVTYSEPPSQFEFPFRNLKIGTKYHARAYAINGKGIAYSDDFVFNTESRDPLIGKELYGGVIAYVLKSGDSGFDPNVKHGIVVAPVDKNGLLTGTFVSTGANSTYGDNACNCLIDNNVTTGTKIGTGRLNTNLLFSIPCKILATPTLTQTFGKGQKTAIGFSTTVTINGFNDWFVPSLDELNALYKNRDVLIMMDDVDIYFWSSSYCGLNKAYAKSFREFPTLPDGLKCDDVVNGGSASSSGYRFRPIRYF